jgi:endonuclease G
MNQQDLLKSAIARIEASDSALAEEFRSVRETQPPASAARILESTAAQDVGPSVGPQSLETIVLRTGRPVLAIMQGEPRLDFREATSEVWRSRLTAAAQALRRAASAVGRINVVGHSQMEWLGTGWLVAPGTIVTNRHVAREFGQSSGSRFVFRQSPAGPSMSATLDFLREMARDDRFDVRILEIVHIEDDNGPDLAFLRIETPQGFEAPVPIPLATSAVSAEQQIAVIGYPARDSRIPDQRLMQSIFGDVYDTKRLAPGQVTAVRPQSLLHDCSTLGGNSGSVLVDLASGKAIGVHFAGRFLEANYAVPAALVAERLEAVRRRMASGTRTGTDAGPPGTGADGSAGAPPPGTTIGDPTAEAEVFAEAQASDYIGRPGYDRAFLGVPVSLPLPSDQSDVLTFSSDGREEHELKYQHFSVVMSHSRRLCILSAVNIDGRTPRRARRPAWRLDPRIPAAQQIRAECYGAEPKFSRGHMTRREDPIWGDVDDANLGNQDSMHVTNVTPQMQPFNAGIWLGLENYALENAREDDMRISVFTGPFLLDDDPVRYGVKVPRSFWKVIAFIHDATDQLCATGYTMSQEDFLRNEEFVFGQHQTWQTPIHVIERRSGVSFGDLTALDPLRDNEEGPSAPLRDFAGIVYTRR